MKKKINIIIGGGCTGLYLAIDRNENFILFETIPVLECKIRTNSLKLDQDAWRVNLKSQTRRTGLDGLRSVEATLSKEDTKTKKKEGGSSHTTVARWAKRHPGGKQLIMDIPPGSDITRKFNTAHSTDYAYAQLLALLE